MKTFKTVLKSSPALCIVVAFVSCIQAAMANEQAISTDNVAAHIESNMIHIQGGTFDMGSPLPTAQPRELPVHQVTLTSFYLLNTEVTQAQFEAVMGWNYSYFQCQQCPVNNVSFKQIKQFITKLNQLTGKIYRLPTEAEWEYAARGGIKSKNYRYSGSNNIAEVAWYAGNANRKSHPVAQKKTNELGLFDMTGNLWEFVEDDMSRQAYQHAEKENPIYQIKTKEGITKLKVVRGSGYEFSPEESDVYKRDGTSDNVRMPDIGFRLALTK